MGIIHILWRDCCMSKKVYVKPLTEMVMVDGKPLCVTYGQMYMCSPGGYYYGDEDDSRQ